MSLPVAARRLFPDHGDSLDLDALDLDANAPFVIGRLLEDGDRDDLAWLFRSYGRERLTAWLRQRGARQLSRRSRAFWRVILEPEASVAGPSSSDITADTTAEDSDIFGALWPL